MWCIPVRTVLLLLDTNRQLFLTFIKQNWIFKKNVFSYLNDFYFFDKYRNHEFVIYLFFLFFSLSDSDFLWWMNTDWLLLSLLLFFVRLKGFFISFPPRLHFLRFFSFFLEISEVKKKEKKVPSIESNLFLFSSSFFSHSLRHLYFIEDFRTIHHPNFSQISCCSHEEEQFMFYYSKLKTTTHVQYTQLYHINLGIFDCCHDPVYHARYRLKQFFPGYLLVMYLRPSAQPLKWK